MLDLAVIIVTWNVRELALQTLRTLTNDLQESGLEAQIYLIDNASSDQTLQAVELQFPDVARIASPENLGFARANNVVLRQLGFGQADASDLPKAVYLLNCDTIVQKGSTRALFEALFSLDHAGLVGANLTYGDGSFQHGAFGFPGLRQLWVEFFPTPGRFIEGHFNGRFPLSSYHSSRSFPVDCVLGATMMLRREVIQQTGMFDEQFYMYCEEIDWAWRIHKAGWGVYCVPNAHVTHLGGQSTSQVRAQSVVNLWTSRLNLFFKHYPFWKRLLAHLLIIVGMWLKLKRLPAAADDYTNGLRTAYRTVARMALKRI